jgi:hypothetical protein
MTVRPTFNCDGIIQSLNQSSVKTALKNLVLLRFKSIQKLNFVFIKREAYFDAKIDELFR